MELVSADAQEEGVILRQDEEGAARADTMLWLTQGEHRLRLGGKLNRSVGPLIVRTMPETHFVRFPQEPRFPELGVFDWTSLKAHVLSSVNTVVGYPDKKSDEAIAQKLDGVLSQN